MGRDEIPQPLGGMGICIVSTSQGVLSGKVDGLAAIGRGDVAIWGMLPLVDNASLIMDRVERYLA